MQDLLSKAGVKKIVPGFYGLCFSVALPENHDFTLCGEPFGALRLQNLLFESRYLWQLGIDHPLLQISGLRVFT